MAPSLTRPRATLVMGLVAATLVASAASVGAADPVDVTATLTGGAAGTHLGCDGAPQVAGTGIHLNITRTGDTGAAATFALTWGGTLVAGTDYETPPSSVTIPEGEVAAPSIDLAPLTDVPGTVTVDGAAPGITSFHSEITTTRVQVPDCNILPSIHQAVEVGSPISIPVGDIAPYVEPLVHDVQLEVIGAPPPGTRFSDDFYPADRKLVGTPTTVGTYTFSFQACLGASLSFCLASQTFTIDVTPIGTGTPPTSTTGGVPGAATPVGAVPVFTG